MNVLNFSFEKNDLNFRKYNGFILIVCLILFILNKLFLNHYHWFFSFYFNDLLATIVLFSFLNTIFPIKLIKYYILIIITAFASFIWEYGALFFKPTAIFDINDIVCYFISLLLYCTLIYYFKNYYLDEGR